MRCVLAGSRYFGATVLEALRKEDGVEFVAVIVPAADDRLALAAQAAGLPIHVLANPKVVPGEAIPDGTDLIVAAHTHARVSPEALARSRLGGIGYHPSLLPRHRGIAAVEWTVLEGDPVAGGSVYHLADGWDAGAIAAQDWCFVGRGESARELWERALAPMGLALLGRVVRQARDHGVLPATAQDARFATRAPMIRRSVVLTDDAPATTTSLVVTVMGPDRPGIVRLLSDRAQRFGANWAASRLSRLAGEFAGMVHFEVPRENAEPLATSLRGLESSDLKLVIAKSDSSQVTAGLRGVELELVGDDRVGIVSTLTRILAESGISIEHIHTEIVGTNASAPKTFKVAAHLLVPNLLSSDELRRRLETVASEMMLDIALGDRAD
ncbi:MAG TPA: formyltransferase family protein [Caldimonas sp.]|jgi:glycine cleavage system regulatory protein/folate-dependent phosphoribosylglycinamide formyltransferase PurN|nr:formyltransferase family protein [Caldimonas sp.]HEX4233797.1 formyltransferase family protein [Caldimonas sp.]